MVLSFLMHMPALSFSPLWMLPVLILAWPLLAPSPKPTKATVKRIVGALLLAVALAGAVAVYAEDATTDVIMRMNCRSKIVFEIFGICL